MTTLSDNRTPGPLVRFEGMIWLVAVCLVSLFSSFPADLPACWLVVGIGLVTLLRMKRAGMYYVALAALFVALNL